MPMFGAGELVNLRAGLRKVGRCRLTLTSPH